MTQDFLSPILPTSFSSELLTIIGKIDRFADYILLNCLHRACAQSSFDDTLFRWDWRQSRHRCWHQFLTLLQPIQDLFGAKRHHECILDVFHVRLLDEGQRWHQWFSDSIAMGVAVRITETVLHWSIKLSFQTSHTFITSQVRSSLRWEVTIAEHPRLGIVLVNWIWALVIPSVVWALRVKCKVKLSISIKSSRQRIVFTVFKDRNSSAHLLTVFLIPDFSICSLCHSYAGLFHSDNIFVKFGDEHLDCEL